MDYVKSYCPYCGEENIFPIKKNTDYIAELEVDLEEFPDADDLKDLEKDFESNPNENSVYEGQRYVLTSCSKCGKGYSLEESKNWEEIAQRFNFSN